MSTILIDSAWHASAPCAAESLGFAPVPALTRDRFDGFGANSAVTSITSPKSVKGMKYGKQFVQTDRPSPGSTDNRSPG